MTLFDTGNYMWAITKLYIGSLSTQTCYTTGERAHLAAMYAKFASSAAFCTSSANTALGWTWEDQAFYVSAVQKLLTARNDKI
jgi:hypothetical protein